ncbi:nuclear transport factor 2-like isoform X2 [Helianthus annuus]|uniref:nuclear transport factor 2-like isoform X2 n=1 Tax=Helianthus annuus TaxID=4232 RepID=UPI000B8F21C5|nr:nuclear transport factor 2-like isoform X2 [Helianthus annuus]
MNATHALLEEEFKKFGPIKPNGIQIRNNRGFYFGFVEFEVPDAVQKAIEASPITINGKNAVVEEKRSTISKVSISTSSSSTLYKPSTTLN